MISAIYGIGEPDHNTFIKRNYTDPKSFPLSWVAFQILNPSGFRRSPLSV
jgi:hypothetical protein